LRKKLDKNSSYVDVNKAYLSPVNIDAIKMIMKEIKYFPKHNFDYLELICWIVSYTKFVKTYKEELETLILFSSNTLAFKAKCEYRILTKGRKLNQAILNK
jgi:hypothetical protein